MRYSRGTVWTGSLIIRTILMSYALFGVVIGVLEHFFPGLLASSWYCYLIAAIAIGLIIAQNVTRDISYGCFLLPNNPCSFCYQRVMAYKSKYCDR